MCADITTHTTDVTDDDKVSFDYEGYRDNVPTYWLKPWSAIKPSRVNVLIYEMQRTHNIDKQERTKFKEITNNQDINEWDTTIEMFMEL